MPRKTQFPSAPNNNGSYRVEIGKRAFGLGTDRAKALQKYHQIVQVYDLHKSWTPETIALATAEITPAPAPTSAPVIPLPQISVATPVVLTQSVVRQTPATTTLTLHQGFRLYIAHTKRRWESKDIGDARYNSVKERLQRVMGNVTDFPLDELKNKDLVDTRLRKPWADRPLITAIGTKKGETKRVPMGWKRAADLIAETKYALTYLAENDDTDGNPLWIAPRNFGKALEVPTKTKAEEKKASKAPATFTLAEVISLYQCCETPQQKLYILAPVMLGWTQIELATLQRDEFLTKDGDYFVDKLRSKTGIQGYWWVCPELAAIMQTYGLADDPDHLMYRTRDGKPLVWSSENGTRCDSTKIVWYGIMRRAQQKGVRPLPYSALRKFALQMVKNLSSHELGKVFAAQTISDGGKDVNEKHYTGRGVNVGIGKTQFEQVIEVQKTMYHELKPHLFPSRAPDTQSVGQSKTETIAA